MDDRRALMAAIISHPDEDTPRLALADWLQEHGNKSDQARAEFIRLQIQLAKSKPGKVAEKLDTAAEQLELKHRKAWLKPLGAISAEFLPEEYIDFRRGLLTYLFLDTGDFLVKARQAALPDALAAVGVEELCFYSATKRIADFAGAPALRWTSGVQYPGADDKMLAALAASPTWAHLSNLNFQQVTFTDAGLKAFAKSTGTSQLRSLIISTDGTLTNRKAKFTAAGVLALLNSDRLPRLESLDLDPGTSKFDIKTFFAAPGLQKLKTLWLTPQIPMADVIASPHLTNLRTGLTLEYEDE